jgi:hypothetical protein
MRAVEATRDGEYGRRRGDFGRDNVTVLNGAVKIKCGMMREGVASFEAVGFTMRRKGNRREEGLARWTV